MVQASSRSDQHVASFDVFDTVLTRRVGNPRALFLLLGRRLAAEGLIGCSAEAFARHRTEAEIRSFRNAGGLDSAVTIYRIYAELAHSLRLHKKQLDELIDQELLLEAESLVVMPEGARSVAAARSRGDMIVFVSDMYLGEAFITDQLVRHQLHEPGDRVFVSCEYSQSKASGSLWPTVLSELDVTVDQIVHTGNDERSDHAVAKKAGLQTKFVEQGNLNRYELELEKWSFHSDGLTSLLAGASRLARLASAADNEHDAALRDVAAGAVAPFVIGNVLWVLRSAKDAGIEKLFFVARDGQVMHDVATALAPKVGYHGEIGYLYGSRQAWVLPGITAVDSELIDSFCPLKGDVDDLSVRKVLHRLGLEPESVKAQLDTYGLGMARWDEHLPHADVMALRSILERDETVRAMIIEEAARQRELMLAYLDEQGALGDASTGIVDLGTGATLYNAFCAVLETIGQQPATAYYFGVRADVTDHGFGFPDSYVRDELNGTGFLSTPGLITLLEMACTADHGSVLSYERTSAGVEPVLAETINTAVVEWGFDIVRSTIRTVAEELRLDSVDGAVGTDLRPAALAAFELFWTSPGRAEATAWGKYPFEDGWGADAVRLPIAHRQGLRSVVQPQPHRHWWNAGARELSGPLSATLLRSREEALSAYRKLRARAG